MAGWASFGPLNNRPWALLVVLAVVLSVLAASLPIASTVRIAVVGKLLGREQLAAQSVTFSIVMYMSMAIFALVSGATAKVARFKAANDKAAVGQQINLIVMFAVVWAVVLCLLLWGLKNPLFDLFNPSPQVRSFADQFYMKFIFAAPLLAANQLLGATILGLRKYLVQAAFVLITSCFDIASVFIIYYRFDAQNNDPIAYEIIASRVVLFIILIIYFYRPSMRRRYKMFPLKFDGDILKRFMVDSGFLFARGVVIMATYFGSPVAASRLGTTQLDAHSIMSNLYFYPVLIGDSIGTACNIVGSRFIGQRKFASFRRLVLYATLAASFVSIAFVCIFTFARDVIFRSFTKDLAIIDAGYECWWIVVGTAAMAPFVGVYEGLAMSRHYFKVLFFCVFAAVGGVYLPILIYNGFQTHMLAYIWAAIIGLELVRGAPVIIAVLWGLRGDPKRDEFPSLDSSTEPYMTEEERAALFSSAPHSINGGEDEYASLPYPDGPPK
eukprot:TRINITY_DN8619_c0_g1_i1.p1 TRINITY_DN8619_c0_g1~~TRINITY_DN8619_c0_g1_i1.p1  ORF type:complete len:510 (-),score=90.75 TRINITY_DN8619_c0_g1_i1:11-1501(-)